ncbi:MAG TPA: recombinase-like helix-turn-helix domain-containing protein [Alphaproteobacteria bacterium]
MDTYNIALKDWPGSSVGAKGDEASIEHPDKAQNICWQTRAAAPTAYEDALGDALQAIFAEEIYELAGIVRRLNERGVKGPDGAAWTEASFTAEMARLGA